jgi:8-oxo-dGTP pyrophosphatase MutT (NUDIX family)
MIRHHRIGSGGDKFYGKKAAGILFTDGRSMLLLKRAGEGDHIGTWALPGGKGKEGETDIGNARREAMEETGLDAIPGHRFDSLTKRDGRHRFTTYLYRVGKPFDVTISHEHSDYKWVPIDEVSKLDLHPKFRECLSEFLRMIRKKVTTYAEWRTITDEMNKARVN